MELAYLFIKGRIKPTRKGFEKLENTPYKVFKDSEFCFSNEYNISLKDEAILSITHNPEFVSNFFGDHGKIRSVTSVVGMNGTGKSSILELIKSVNNNNFESFPYKFLAIFRKDAKAEETKTKDKKGCEFIIVHHDDLFFGPGSQTNLPANCAISKIISTSQITKHQERVPEHRTIYLSNILEVTGSRFSDLNIYADNLDDISSTALLNGDVITKLNKEARFTFEDCYHSFRLMESNRQLNFLLNKRDFRMIKLDLPPFAVIQPDSFYEIELNEALKNQSFGHTTNTFNAVAKSMTNLKDQFCFSLHRSVYFYLVRYFALEVVNADFDIYKLTTEAFSSNNISNDRIKQFIQKIISQFNKVNSDEKIIDPFKNILSVLGYVDNLPFENFIPGLNSNPCAVLALDENEIFFRSYTKSLFITGYLNLEWRFSPYSTGELSSGEKAMLSVFSRFHYLQKKYTDVPQYNCENLIILIDEGDQLLHPEWQREFLSYLFDFLPKVFSNTSSIQIVLTSHSPFITSDLPRYCVMYLEKDTSGLTKVIPGRNKSHTLGANIHQLYRDSFYMPNSMMGEFARTKIDKLIKELQPIERFETTEQKNEYLKRADLIGERFLSSKIKEIINSKSKSDNDSN